MKAITITNSKYQYICSKSVKSFKRFNDIPLEIYFVGSEIENTLLGDFDCHYIDLHPGDIPNEFKWCKSILKEKLKIFLEQSDDFLFFENDVFFYKKLDFGIFKDGVSGVPEITDSRTKMSVLNGGFLFFKNIKLSYTVDDISSFMECSDYLPDEYFLSKFCSPINFLGYDVCYLNGTIPLVRDPVCVHCYGRYKPFVSSKLDFNKLKSFHARKLGRELG